MSCLHFKISRLRLHRRKPQRSQSVSVTENWSFCRLIMSTPSNSSLRNKSGLSYKVFHKVTFNWWLKSATNPILRFSIPTTKRSLDTMYLPITTRWDLRMCLDMFQGPKKRELCMLKLKQIPKKAHFLWSQAITSWHREISALWTWILEIWASSTTSSKVLKKFKYHSQDWNARRNVKVSQIIILSEVSHFQRFTVSWCALGRKLFNCLKKRSQWQN